MESERVHRWLLREAGRRGPVIEIGCGDGRLSIDLARRGLAVTAVDLDADPLQHAREAAKAAGVAGGIAWLQADGQQLSGVPSGAYRVAVLAFVLHHMDDPQEGLRSAWRVLAPRGRLLVAEMLPRGPDAGDLCHRTPLAQWLAWLAGLEPSGVRMTVLPRQEWLLAALEKQAPAVHQRHSSRSPSPRRPAAAEGAHPSRVVVRLRGGRLLCRTPGVPGNGCQT